MDLKLSSGVASAVERTTIDAHVTAHGTARDQLLPLLHAVNDRVGWLSPGAISHLAAAIDVAPAEIFGVASFYDLFSLQPRSGPVVHRCVDIACQVNGAVVADNQDGVFFRAVFFKRLADQPLVDIAAETALRSD